MIEPTIKRAVAFFDGQNLYHHAKFAFGHHHPNYEPTQLTNSVCASVGAVNHGVRFYTGVPSATHNLFWHRYWSRRLLAMRRSGIFVTSRPLSYVSTEIKLADGTMQRIQTPQEKGIDVRLALDVVLLALQNQYDVGVIFSQNQDLAEVAEEVREISRSQGRWIKLYSAYPAGPNASVRRGIDKTDWFPMDEMFYNACLDLRDYR